MATINQALIFYWVVILICYIIGYNISNIEKIENGSIGVGCGLLINTILYKYNHANFK